MTPPEVDQELARLLAVARNADVPDADARARIRALLARKLPSAGAVAASSWGPRVWSMVGVVVVGAGALALWQASALPTPASGALVVPSVAVSPPVAPVPSSALPASPAVPAPEVTASAPTPSSETSRPKPTRRVEKAAAASSQTSEDAEELSLVRAMQQALRGGNPHRALALAGEHARRFPRGSLIEEREGVHAVASCQVAASHARPQIVSAFMQRFATSPYASRVKAACQ